jgi:hypothetical protein
LPEIRRSSAPPSSPASRWSSPCPHDKVRDDRGLAYDVSRLDGRLPRQCSASVTSRPRKRGLQRTPRHRKINWTG